MAKKNSSEYWEKRIADATWKTYNTLEEKNKELLEFYIDASKAVKEELYTLAEKYSRDGVLTLSEMHKQNRLTKLDKNYEKIAYELGKETEAAAMKNMQEGFRDVYKSTAIGMGDIDFSMPNKKLMDKLLHEPWRGDSFSGRLWKNQKKLAAGLNEFLLTGLQQGKTVTEIAVNLHNFMGQSFNNCHRLVRTEAMHYLNNATLKRYKDADIKYVQIWAAQDERTCETCGSYHGKVYPIDKAPVLPFHANCRCTYLPVTDNAGANNLFVFKDEPVYYNKNAEYIINLDEYPTIVNEGLSKAAENVARHGSEDRFEHMHLVNLKNGNIEYSEDGDKDSVGYKFTEYILKHKNNSYAFIHNHNIVSSLSEADLTTPVTNPNIVMQIAVQNDGLKYIAIRRKEIPQSYYPDFYFEEDLEELNKLSRSGKITPIERGYKREEIIVNCLIREFYGGKVMILDGRKNK